MAFLLSLVDAEDTIDFLSVIYQLEDGGFLIGQPQKQESWGANASYGGGKALVDVKYGNRILELTFSVTGSSLDDLLANINRIESALSRCQNERMNNNLQKKTELQYKWEDASATNYFQILSGSLEWPRDIMSVSQIHQRDSFGNYILNEFKLTLIASPFIDSVSPVTGVPLELPLSNHDNTTPATGGIVLEGINNVGESRSNYVYISGSDIPGDAPAEVYIQIGNPSASTLKRVVLGVGDPPYNHLTQNFKWSAESQSFSYPSEDPLLIKRANALADNGYDVPMVIGASDINKLIACIYYEDIGIVAGLTGMPPGAYRFYAVFYPSTSTTARFKLALRTSPAYSFTEVAMGDWHQVSNAPLHYVDLGTFILPPYTIGPGQDPTFNTLTGILYGYFETTGTYYLDCLIATPITDYMRVLECTDGTLGEFDSFYDDSENRILSIASDSGYAALNTIGSMPQIRLKPGEDKIISVLPEFWNTTYYRTYINSASDIRVHVYPKYKNVIG